MHSTILTIFTLALLDKSFILYVVVTGFAVIPGSANNRYFNIILVINWYYLKSTRDQKIAMYLKSSMTVNVLLHTLMPTFSKVTKILNDTKTEYNYK